MKIDNETRYSTVALRKFFLCGLKAAGFSPAVIARYYIKVTYKKSNTRYVGWAYKGHCWIHMLISRPPAVQDLKHFGQTFIHETDHNKGLAHRDMRHSHLIDVPWADRFNEIEHLGPKKQPKSKGTRQEHSAANAQRKLAEWEKKVKHAQTYAAKWRKKVRYYEGALKRKAADKERTDA